MSATSLDCQPRPAEIRLMSPVSIQLTLSPVPISYPGHSRATTSASSTVLPKMEWSSQQATLVPVHPLASTFHLPWHPPLHSRPRAFATPSKVGRETNSCFGSTAPPLRPNEKRQPRRLSRPIYYSVWLRLCRTARLSPGLHCACTLA